MTGYGLAPINQAAFTLQTFISSEIVVDWVERVYIRGM